MFRPLPLYIGVRYLYTKRRNHFISFITGISMLGIALGVTVLVTVLSIMNGFDQVIREKIADTAQHITIQDLRRDVPLEDWWKLRKNMLKATHVLGAAPFLATQGLLAHAADSQPTMLYGIVPTLENSVSSLSHKIIQGHFALDAHQPQLILGEQLAYRLNAKVGSQVTLYLPILNKNFLNFKPRSQTLKVTGIFRTGKGLGLDNTFAYISLKTLQMLHQSTDAMTGLRLKIDNLYEAPALAARLTEHLPDHYIVSDWTEQYGSLMTAIALEKTITLWILLLLVAIAAFNLVSSLVMVVTEKKAEIAIFRTLGMRTTTILNIFIIQGSLIGLLGTLLGLGTGFFLSQHISQIAALLEQWFHLELFAGNIFIQKLPSHIEAFDFIRVGIASFSISVIATIYPAWRATRTLPIEALRYE